MLVLYLAILCSFAISSCSVLKQQHAAIKQKDGIDIALLEDKESILDPQTHDVPVERLVTAKTYKDELLERKTRGAIPGINWVSLGSQNQAGRSRCVLVDLSDPSGNTVWVGSVGGGLWKCTNINNAQPNWASNTQLLDNLCVVDIVQHPSTLGTMYVSTGEAQGGSGAIRGLGIFKSTDTGNTWTQLASTNNSTFHYSSRLLVLANGNLLVATNGGGLQLSTNGGNSFTKVLGSGLGITGANSDFASDIELASNGDLYASINGSLHKSTNNGSTWSAAIGLPILASRIEIACAPSDANYLYLLVENGGVVNGILRSINAGSSFTARTEPDDIDPGIPATDFSRGQAWYDLAVAVDPTDRNVLWVGGIDLFKSTNGGNTWQQQSHWYGSTYQYVHADQHDIYFSPLAASTMYFVNDGGIDQVQNAAASNVTFAYKGYNYNTIQFYGCAMHPTAGQPYYLAGAQDNGTHQFTQDVFGPTNEVTGGDGAFCHIDQLDAMFQFGAYVYNNYERSTNGGNTFSSVNYANTGRFINPTDYDNVNARMYCANNADEYLVWTDPKTGSTFQTKTLTQLGAARVSAVTVSPNTVDRVFFGSGSGKVLRVDNAASTPTVTDITSASMPASVYVSCIEVETGNDNHLIAVFRNYGINSVWETTNGGTTWTSIEGNLPDVPVRWALINPSNNTQAMVATELGVWSTDLLQGTNTAWAPSNSGLANVRVDMLQTRTSDKLVIAATHGRGLFLTDVFADPQAKFTVAAQIAYIGQDVRFDNTSIKASSNSWDFGDGATSTAVSPVHKYTTPGIYTVELSINNGVSIETKNNYITVLPNRNAPYTAAQGGSFEVNINDFAADSIQGTTWELGNSTIPGKDGTSSGANAWITGINENTYGNNVTSYLYTPMFALPASPAQTLAFSTKFDLELEYDGFTVEWSTDSGATWQTLGSSVAPDWYNYSNAPQVSLVFPLGQAFFNGSVGSFTTMQYDLSALANKKVAFRFAFKTDDFVVNPGIAIDDFQLISSTGAPLSTSSISLSGENASETAHLLYWNPCTNTDGYQYEVLKSKDGVNFSLLTTLERSAQTNLQMSYTTTEPGAAHYIVKARNGVNEVATSNTIFLGDGQGALTMSPNPAQEFVHFSGIGEVRKVAIVDNEGRIVLMDKVTNNILRIPDATRPGCYTCRVYTKAGVWQRKLTIGR
jgi:PKD repeat protein